MNENVKVVVRCRPMNRKEIENKSENVVDISDYMVTVLNPMDRASPRKSFTFDSVYDSLSKSEVLYNDMCYSLVESTLEGYNGTIFAYGQTGCGKTHTMQGEERCGLDMDHGIIPRCFDHIFETIAMSNSRYLAFVSYLEIYNENIRDLLSSNTTKMTNHTLKDVPGVGITVPTLTTHTVVSSKECYVWLNVGNKNKVTAATSMNETSSRSHTIFTISLEQIQATSQSTAIATENFAGGIRRGKLNLVDLAGSERQRKTGAFGERLKEASKINLSLSALGNVISSLVDGKTKHVPYRDSKLTRLLQDSLGGNTKTLMIACISPADINYDETLSTLRYASRAKNIANIPTINEDPKDAKLRQYQEEIIKLKKLIDESVHDENFFLRKFSSKVNEDGEKPIFLKNKMSILGRETQENIDNITERGASPPNEITSRPITHAISTITTESESINKEEIQLHARKRIELIKHALIGGERANDIQLKERHMKRKRDAQRHLSAIAHALSRVNQIEDRDLLQGHYANIQQEIIVKNDHIKKCSEKIKMLELEVSDLNSEFQLDREDYLDEIRHLGRHIKFYQQLLQMALPILRKSGKHWNPDHILESSSWNDDLRSWQLPDTIMNPFKLPPATLTTNFHQRSILPIEDIKYSEKKIDGNLTTVTSKSDNYMDCVTEDPGESYKINVLKNYFRPNRLKNKELFHATKNWKEGKQYETKP